MGSNEGSNDLVPVPDRFHKDPLNEIIIMALTSVLHMLFAIHFKNKNKSMYILLKCKYNMTQAAVVHYSPKTSS